MSHFKKTTFKIPKMNCPSEEQIIRLTLNKLSGVHQLEFDFQKRMLVLLHEGDAQLFFDALLPLGLGVTMIKTNLVDADELPTINTTANIDERKILKILLLINSFMFFSEIILGWIAESTGLIADSVDMFADATVYGLSLYAVGHSIIKQVRAAKVSGYFQLLLALGALAEVIRRFIFGSEPEPIYMIIVALIALLANISCMVLLAKHRHGGVHMKASWIFSTNDVIANIGVIIAGILVSTLDSRVPDLIIGSIISAIVFYGALKIFRISKETT